MHHVVIEGWARRTSPLHACDARLKAIAALAVLIAIALARSPVLLGWYAAAVLCGIAAARLPVRTVLLRAAYVLPFAATFAIARWIAGDSERAAYLAVKSYMSALVALLLVGTTPVPELLRALAKLGAPRFLLEVLQYLYRYLFVVSEQAQHMRLAAACRGSLRHAGFRAAAGAVGILFARSYARAEGIHDAMLARGEGAPGNGSPEKQREVGRTPSSARDPLVAPGAALHDAVGADEGVGRGPGGPPYLRRATAPFREQQGPLDGGARRGPLVQVRGLKYRYDDGTVALAGVDFDLAPGETVAIFGPNGSGKTTFVHHLNGLLRGEGSVVVCGMPVERRTLPDIRRKVGLVFQDSDTQLFMPTVLEDVAYGPHNLGLDHDAADKRALDALRQVGMEHAAARAPYHLSAGEKKRVALAGVLAMDPEILVLDEPTTFLDPPAVRELACLLGRLPQARIIVTHDALFARALAGRAVFFQNGKIAAEAGVDEVIRRFAWDPRTE